MPKVLALIGDMAGSRSLTDRNTVQERLAAALEASNKRKQPLSPLTITLGDEFQGLYRDATGLFAEITAIECALHPVNLRFGLGIGSLKTPVNSSQAIGMDGPAFYRARSSISRAKEDEAWLCVEGDEEEPVCSIINGFCSLFWRALHESRSTNPHALLEAELAGQTDRELAARLGISPSNVTRAKQVLKIDSGAATLRAIEEALNRMLNEGD